uniref:Lnb N-terminal periplasmic domain-containing protein n=1 Tax=Solibacter usitatus (strain Ellin6076) TaxID=234267 RepID=Q01UC1_SOLUE
MISIERQPKRGPAFWLFQPFRWLMLALGFLLKAAVTGWATLAIYYSNLPWAGLRLALAAAFLVFAIWALWRARTPRALLAFGGVFLAVVVWWISIRPSHHRPWRPEVAVMPRVSIDGDRVRIMGVRNFEYRSTYDFTPLYEQREVSLSSLTSIDFYISYWMQGPVGHTFLSFNFSNAPPVCISIETRPEVGEGFSPIASLFKQFELIYVVGDERDLVRVRTNFRRDYVYLYHIRTSAENARRLFLIYLDRINELYDQPEFYHLLSNSCTINIVRYARAAGKPRDFDIRHFLNGLIDSYLYSIGVVDTTLPFAELRRRSRINDAAVAADNAPDFSERIRAAVPAPGE